MTRGRRDVDLQWDVDLHCHSTISDGALVPAAVVLIAGGGARLGGMEFASPIAATVALAIGWAFLTPLLCRLALHFDGYAGDTDVVNSPR